MNVSKQQVVDFIRDRGDAARAAVAESELPELLELPRDEDLVTKFGVDPDDLSDEPDRG